MGVDVSRKHYQLVGSKLVPIADESKPDQETKPAKTKAESVASAEPAPETDLKEVENDSSST